MPGPIRVLAGMAILAALTSHVILLDDVALVTGVHRSRLDLIVNLVPPIHHHVFRSPTVRRRPDDDDERICIRRPRNLLLHMVARGNDLRFRRFCSPAAHQQHEQHGHDRHHNPSDHLGTRSCRFLARFTLGRVVGIRHMPENLRTPPR